VDITSQRGWILPVRGGGYYQSEGVDITSQKGWILPVRGGGYNQSEGVDITSQRGWITLTSLTCHIFVCLFKPGPEFPTPNDVFSFVTII
jgi:hypothetical protein